MKSAHSSYYMAKLTISKASNGTQDSIVADWLEVVDPNPDVHALFCQFDAAYFWCRLAACEVRWSPRMTLCAGQCHYDFCTGLCSIRLSKALLQYRPRKDLVETLLHEMIHAYLFVTKNNRDRDGHGPEFQEHMHRINRIAKTNITIYHNFHNEVNFYHTHWWRCNGPCQNRRPFYGWVKRAMNRPPGPNDPWWADHKRTCGGTFLKVKEPAKSKVNGKIRLGNRVNATQSDRRSAQPSIEFFLKGTSKERAKKPFIPFSGVGHVLGSSSKTNGITVTSAVTDGTIDVKRVLGTEKPQSSRCTAPGADDSISVIELTGS